MSYGRILRDEEGNVVDIILPDEDDAAGGRGVDEELDENERVEGKTDIVRSQSSQPSFVGSTDDGSSAGRAL